MKKHILIVDDEVEIRDLLTRCLSGSYRITAVASAADAKRTVQTDPPHLLISDLQLEDSDGLEMIEELKALLPDLPVILLTGVLFDAEVVSETLDKKVSAYLPKTSPLTRILDEIKRLLDR